MKLFSAISAFCMVFVFAACSGSVVIDPWQSSGASSGAGGDKMTSSVSSTSSAGGMGGDSSTSTSQSVSSAVSSSAVTSSTSSGPFIPTTEYCLTENKTDPHPGAVNCECGGKIGQDIEYKFACKPNDNPDKVPMPGDLMKCICSENGAPFGVCFDVAPQLNQPTALECSLDGCCGDFYGL